jgi:hypothetical protein
MHQVQIAMVVERELPGELTFDLVGEDAVEILGGKQGAVRVAWTERLASKTTIVVGHVLGQVSVPVFGSRDASKAQLLDQPILQRRVGSLDTALGHVPQSVDFRVAVES